MTRADLVRSFTRGDEEVELEIKRDVLLSKLWIATHVAGRAGTTGGGQDARLTDGPFSTLRMTDG